MKLKEVKIIDMESELDNLRMNLLLPYHESQEHIKWLKTKINQLEKLIK